MQQEEDIKTPVMASADTALLLSTVNDAIQRKKSALELERVALEQAQKAFTRLKGSISQQAKQAEIEKMQSRSDNWQREIEQLEDARERLFVSP